MLRKIVRCGRRRIVTDDGEAVLEPWVEWAIRATRKAEEARDRAGIKSWVDLQKERKDKLMQKTARAEGGRWARRLLLWIPFGLRRPGRPFKRWTD